LNLLSLIPMKWWPARSTSLSVGTGIQSIGPVSQAIEGVRNVSSDLALQVSAVWACVTLNSNMIAQMPCFVYEKKADGTKTLARNSTLYTVLHGQPNNYQTAYEFWQTMGLSYWLKGNAYARMRFNGAGELVSLTPIPSDLVEPVVLDNGDLVYEIWNKDSVEVVPASRIFHWRGLGNGVVGLSRMDFARSTIGITLDAQEHSAKTYRNGGRRTFMLHFDRVLTDEQREAVKRRQREYNLDTSQSLYFFEGVGKVETLGLSPADLKTLENLQNGTQEIGRWFGVPGVMINDSSQTTVWGSGVSEIVQGYFKTTLGPEIVGLQQSLMRQVLTIEQRSRYVIEFSPDALLRMNAKDRAELHAKNVQNGLKTRNEVRQLENDPPIDGGDELTVQSNLLPINKLGIVAGKAINGIQEPIAQ
jgi:HK97 family phage portal protein